MKTLELLSPLYSGTTYGGQKLEKDVITLRVY
jgi:hypothetical protein